MNVLVGVDGSPNSIASLRYAWRIVEPAGGKITAITAWHMPQGYGDVALPDWDPSQDAEKISGEALKEAFDGNVPAAVSAEIVQGPPAQILIDRSPDVDLVVVGSRGHGGFTGLLLGSVSSAVAAHAHAPVLVYHDKA